MELVEKIGRCSVCGNLSQGDRCGVCADRNRDRNTICVVESFKDLYAFEATESYKGVYHVIGGVISALDGVGPESLRIDELLERAKDPNVKEIIIGLSPTVAGDTTALYIEKCLKVCR